MGPRIEHGYTRNSMLVYIGPYYFTRKTYELKLLNCIIFISYLAGVLVEFMFLVDYRQYLADHL